jgi:hypothetical protein
MDAEYSFYICPADWNFPADECNAIFHMQQLTKTFHADNYWQNWIFAAGTMKQWLQASVLVFDHIFSSNVNLTPST